MKFEYFRFLLSPVKEPKFPFDGPITREDVIKKIFLVENNPYRFENGRAKYGYASLNRSGDMVYGRLGRESKKKLHSSPDKKFLEKQEEDWPGCRVFINFADEKSSGKMWEMGQVIAIEVNKSAISNNTNALRGLADHINKSIVEYGFHIAINPILTERKRFWAVVKENEGQIRKVTLSYTPPNLFNLKNKLEDDLREANKTFNTTSTQITLENDSGELVLPTDNPLLNESAQYIDQGSGSYQIHLKKGKKVIKSEEGVKTETFNGLEMTIEGMTSSGVAEIMNSILRGEISDE